jgi:hypothetical protein
MSTTIVTVQEAEGLVAQDSDQRWCSSPLAMCTLSGEQMEASITGGVVQGLNKGAEAGQTRCQPG